jgi:ubiquitin carboxyl-terminal hydrolase 9/24
MDEDENLSMLLAMGFPDIGEIRRALRIAKNDINEAVAILTNDQPISNEIDMQDISSSGGKNETENTSGDGGFPTTHLYELEQRVFQVRPSLFLISDKKSS